MNTKVKYFIIILSCLIVFVSSNHVYALPSIFNLVIDASASVSEKDFTKANKVVSEFIELLHERSKYHEDERADWLSVNWFGGADSYDGTSFINCSNILKMAFLSEFLDGKKHPKHDYTAIYSAIEWGTKEVIHRDLLLPGYYLKTLIIVTDGEDNNSPEKAKNFVKEFYPNDDIFLFVVGVGDNAQIKEFEKYSTKIVKINNFGELLGTLTLLIELIPN